MGTEIIRGGVERPPRPIKVRQGARLLRVNIIDNTETSNYSEIIHLKVWLKSSEITGLNGLYFSVKLF